ncbi:MAG: putative quinol monooxygenase [Pedobacter sp.]
MDKNQLVVLARFKAREGKEDQAHNELTALVAPTRTEPGCKYYACHAVQESPGEFVFYEIWETRQALDEHIQKPYLQAILGKAEELFAEAPDIRFLEKLV